jgi:hypothetical protein
MCERREAVDINSGLCGFFAAKTEFKRKQWFLVYTYIIIRKKYGQLAWLRCRDIVF